MSGAQINFLEEIIVDNFAGGGGASTGIELATGRPVTIAINHDPLSVTEFGDDDALFEHATAIRDTVVNTTVVGGHIQFRR